MSNETLPCSRRSLLKIGVVGSPTLTAGCLRLDESDGSSTAEGGTGTGPESGNGTGTSSDTGGENGTSTGTAVQDPTGSVVLADQETDGSSVTVAEVETNVEAIIQVYDGNGEFLANPGIRFEPGETRRDISIQLESSLSAATEVTVKLFWCEEAGPNTCNGPPIASETATVSPVSTGTARASETSPSGSIVFRDQETDGTYVTVAEVQTNVEAIIQVYDGNGDFIANPGIRFQSGETRNDLEIELGTALSATQAASVKLFWCEEAGPNTCNGPTIARETATVTVE
ncbi:hypothetical protein [Halorubellus sp. PRR65]|uniref:hypothetical protein n=1 Tax=Halorubellus sp. PRR65 TaxID=3098148 RepID=UPI002B2637D8|nr:hypothetical protein [Halorubellus sp. PRR65]